MAKKKKSYLHDCHFAVVVLSLNINSDSTYTHVLLYFKLRYKFRSYTRNIHKLRVKILCER